MAANAKKLTASVEGEYLIIRVPHFAATSPAANGPSMSVKVPGSVPVTFPNVGGSTLPKDPPVKLNCDTTAWLFASPPKMEPSVSWYSL